MIFWTVIYITVQELRTEQNSYCSMLLNTGQNINPLGHSMSNQPVMEHMSWIVFKTSGLFQIY